MSSRLNRRRFLQTSAAAVGASYWLTATATSATRAGQQPSEAVRFAGIGIGGKGGGDIDQASALGQVVALCDIDEGILNRVAGKYRAAKKYTDYRKMFDEIGKEIDAVTVGTPDHTHAPISVMAMKLGKHVYCQKPLTHTVKEARTMREVAEKSGVCTQMGNQGSASNGLRRAVEVVQAGLIGPVREAHVWTNRPANFWKQAPDVVSRPSEKPVPAGVHWNDWLGPAPVRPYAEYEQGGRGRRAGAAYHPFVWRGWWDFGTGALGDMACHTANLAYRALNLGYPTSVVADATDVNPETYPSSAHITFRFPARGEMPPVAFHWYEGKRNGKKLTPPDDLVAKAVVVDTVPRHQGRLVDSGCILVGEKGLLYSPDDYGTQWFLHPAEKFADANRSQPEKLPTNNRGDSGMKREWVQAMKDKKPETAYSSFGFAAMLTETILLGNVAIRLTGQRLDWDGPNMAFSNNREANKHLHYEYRQGWTL